MLGRQTPMKLVLTAIFLTIGIYTLLQPCTQQTTQQTRAASRHNNLDMQHETPQLLTRHPTSAVDTDGYSTTKKVILFTHYRSGSSFMGSIFRQNALIHYMYEPFKLVVTYGDKHAAKTLQPHIGNYTLDLLNCRFHTVLKQARTVLNSTVISKHVREVFEQTMTRYGNSESIHINLLQDVCHSYPINVMKIIRGTDLQNMAPLMQEHDVTVILLVRDPRATIISRLRVEAAALHRSYYDHIARSVTDKVITDMARSHCRILTRHMHFLNNASDYSGLYREHLAVIRYEDLAYTPLEVTRQVYKFLRQPLPMEVVHWLQRHTSGPARLQSPFSLLRNSQFAADSWRTLAPSSIITTIEHHCVHVLNYFGYKTIEDTSELRNLNTSLVGMPSKRLKFYIT